MHLSSCLHPKRVFNPYLKEFMYVPCGKCDACRNKRVFDWTSRLDYECRCWKYVAFVTLTYNEDNLPRLEYINDLYIDLTHAHTAEGQKSPCVDLGFIREQPDVDVRRLNEWVSVNPTIPYLSVYDLQCFIKRFRKNLYNTIKKQFPLNYEASDYKVRYFACGELGSTFARPHYHLLFFFSSDKTSKVFDEVLSKSWKLGITDWSFVQSTASSYVASYLNSDSNFSPVYKYCKQIRPFQLCSKQPPIGTLFFNEEEVRKIFDECSPTFSLPKFASQTYVNVPLWKTFTYRLYPRLSCFDFLSSSDRVGLYRAYYKALDYYVDNCSDFVSRVLTCFDKKIFNSFYSHLFDDYVNRLNENVSGSREALIRSITRWYYISSRVCHQAEVWMMTVDNYVSKISKFYENVEIEKLKSQYEYLVDFCERDPNTQFPIAFYLDFLQSIFNYDLTLSDVDSKTLLILDSFNIDVSRFFSPDIDVRQSYYDELTLFNQHEFLCYSLDHLNWSRKLVKNKKKNEYLMSHPEKVNLIY